MPFDTTVALGVTAVLAAHSRDAGLAVTAAVVLAAKGLVIPGRLRVASGGPVTRMEGPRWYDDTQATARRRLTTPTQAQARPDLGPDSVSVLRPSGQPGC
jgi:hypothetical protein